MRVRDLLRKREGRQQRLEKRRCRALLHCEDVKMQTKTKLGMLRSSWTWRAIPKHVYARDGRDTAKQFRGDFHDVGQSALAGVRLSDPNPQRGYGRERVRNVDFMFLYRVTTEPLSHRPATSELSQVGVIEPEYVTIVVKVLQTVAT